MSDKIEQTSKTGETHLLNDTNAINYKKENDITPPPITNVAATKSNDEISLDELIKKTKNILETNNAHIKILSEKLDNLQNNKEAPNTKHTIGNKLLERVKRFYNRMKTNEFIEDIKVFFDALRNMGISVSFGLVGFLDKPYISGANSEIITFILNQSLYATTLILLSFNIYWAYNTTKDKGNKYTFIGSLLLITILTSATVFTLKAG
jgi:hypothetical protein